ncbi:acyltransferase [Rhizobium sp. CNPSo 4039]|uniref:acyltransferase family protein n=1 Tax=Rhizobium sp. CNPSo 4039 TaxID=3021409 RepID=UPI00254CAF61|nr:acyltransferase [Rhizobium sp. CNPSo 4039]MDK4712979.1 acyltransferase [Rhizobium sp. CNPSo 4039]
MQRFVLLDFVRFLLAILVAMQHFGGFAAPHKAYLAVDFFFILSGFVLCHAYVARAASPNFFRSYLTDRLARLYPLHLLMLVILVPINILFFWSTGGQFLESGWSYQDGRIYTFILNLVLLQNVGLTTHGSWNAPSWSISVEMVVNIALAGVITAVAKDRRVWQWLLVISLCSYAILMVEFGSLVTIYDRAFGVLNTGLLRGIGGISLGAIAYQVHEAIVPANRTRHLTILSTACAIAVLAIMVASTQPSMIDFVAVPAMFIFIVSTSAVEAARPIQKGHVRTAMEAAGALSYAIYLCHWPILTFARYQLSYAWGWKIDFGSPFVLLAFLATVLISASLCYPFFERPAKSTIRRVLAPQRASPTPPESLSRSKR